LNEAEASPGTHPYPPIVRAGGAHGTIARAGSRPRRGDLGFRRKPGERDRAREILLSKKPVAFYEIGSSIGGMKAETFGRLPTAANTPTASNAPTAANTLTAAAHRLFWSLLDYFGGFGSFCHHFGPHLGAILYQFGIIFGRILADSPRNPNLDPNCAPPPGPPPDPYPYPPHTHHTPPRVRLRSASARCV
jgi:hypothetical protein